MSQRRSTDAPQQQRRSRSIIDLDLDENADGEDLALVAFSDPEPPITTFAQLKKALRDPLYLSSTPMGHHFRKALLQRIEGGA